MDLIYKHATSGGEIWQCGAMEIPGVARSFNKLAYIHCPYVVEGMAPLKFTILALTAKGFQPQIETATAGSGLEVLHLPFADKPNLDPGEIIRVRDMILPAAEKMAKTVEQGQKVLSTCWGGINRSSLLTAFVLKNLDQTLNSEAGGHFIVSLLRGQRAAHCLNNKLFKKIVRTNEWS
jgi:hypothetical protein